MNMKKKFCPCCGNKLNGGGDQDDTLDTLSAALNELKDRSKKYIEKFNTSTETCSIRMPGMFKKLSRETRC